jgi:hypothetical protein
MAVFRRLVLSIIASVLIGWAVYGLASWALSFASLSALNRAAMSLVAALLFVGACWMADLRSYFQKPPLD